MEEGPRDGRRLSITVLPQWARPWSTAPDTPGVAPPGQLLATPTPLATELSHRIRGFTDKIDELKSKLVESLTAVPVPPPGRTFALRRRLEGVEKQLAAAENRQALFDLIDRLGDEPVSQMNLTLTLKRNAMRHARQCRMVDWARFIDLGRPVVSVRLLHGYTAWRTAYRKPVLAIRRGAHAPLRRRGLSQLRKVPTLGQVIRRVLYQTGMTRLRLLLTFKNRTNERLLRRVHKYHRSTLEYKTLHWLGWSKMAKRARQCMALGVTRQQTQQLRSVLASAERVTDLLLTLRLQMHRWNRADLRRRLQHWVGLSRLPHPSEALKCTAVWKCMLTWFRRSVEPWRLKAVRTLQLKARCREFEGTWPHIYTRTAAWRAWRGMALGLRTMQEVLRKMLHKHVSQAMDLWRDYLAHRRKARLLRWTCGHLRNQQASQTWNSWLAEFWACCKQQELETVVQRFWLGKGVTQLQLNQKSVSMNKELMAKSSRISAQRSIRKGFRAIQEFVQELIMMYHKFQKMAFRFLQHAVADAWQKWHTWSLCQVAAVPLICKAAKNVKLMELFLHWNTLRDFYWNAKHPVVQLSKPTISFDVNPKGKAKQLNQQIGDTKAQLQEARAKAGDLQNSPEAVEEISRLKAEITELENQHCETAKKETPPLVSKGRLRRGVPTRKRPNTASNLHVQQSRNSPTGRVISNETQQTPCRTEAAQDRTMGTRDPERSSHRNPDMDQTIVKQKDAPGATQTSRATRRMQSSNHTEGRDEFAAVPPEPLNQEHACSKTRAKGASYTVSSRWLRRHPCTPRPPATAPIGGQRPMFNATVSKACMPEVIGRNLSPPKPAFPPLVHVDSN